MAQIPPWLLELVCESLSISDLAHLASTCRPVNRLVTPYLYRTLRFHCPGHIGFEDTVLQKLDLLADPRFQGLIHTTQVFVTGSWYDTYKEIESDLSPHQLLSPAVRMFNTIISSCVVRMPKLRTFIWDLQVSLTQTLLTTIMERPSLEHIQLRLGTDSTPKPFFRPTLEFHQPVSVKVMRFVQVNDPAVLQSVSLAISQAVHLQELSILADEESGLSLDSLLASCKGKPALQLRSLDLQGFVAFGTTSRSFWNTLSPSKLYELTLHLGGTAQMTECADFWDESIKAGLQPRWLSSNLALPGLKEFLLSFSGLEVFSITPPSPSPSIEPLLPLLEALQEKHSATIKSLAIDPGDFSADYTLDLNTIEKLSAAFSGIEELRFGLAKPSLRIIKAALRGFRLRTLHVLHINGIEAETERISQTSILKYLDQGYASYLEYIVFDDGPVHRILRTSDRCQLQKQPSIGGISNSVILQERMLNWVRAFKSSRGSESTDII